MIGRRQVALGLAAAFGATFPASEAWACSLNVIDRIEAHYAGIEPGSPEEARLDRKRERDRYRVLRKQAKAGKIGDPKDFAVNVVNALVPPVVAGPDHGVSMCGSGVPGDADAAGHRSVKSFAAEFEAKIGAPINWYYGSSSAHYFEQYIAIPHRCNVEFRQSIAPKLAMLASAADLAVLWAELWAHDFSYGPLSSGSDWGSMRLMRFKAGRSGPLVPYGPGLLYEPTGRDLAIRPVLAKHHRAMVSFLSENPAALRIIAILDTAIAEAQARPGGDERLCPAAMAEAEELIFYAKRRMAEEQR